MVVLLGVTMRRHWVCLSIFAVLSVALVVPSLALAQTTFQIKDAHGRVCGSISSRDEVNWRVVNSHGTLVGWLGEGVHPACNVWHAPANSGPLVCACAYQNVLHPSWQSSSPNAVIGKAVRAHGRWLLKQRVSGHYKTLGSAPIRCRNYDALGAAYLLLWPHAGAPWGSWTVKTVDGGYWGTIWSTTPATYGDPLYGSTPTGPGATVWQQYAGAAPYYAGEVSHAMTENGPVSDRWVLFDADWQEQFMWWVQRVNKDLYSVVDSDTGMSIGRAVRTSSGPWRLQVLEGVSWLTEAAVPRSCPGAWAAWAEMFLPLPGGSDGTGRGGSFNSDANSLSLPNRSLNPAAVPSLSPLPGLHWPRMLEDARDSS